MIFSNDNTAAPYTAISDGEIREADLITCSPRAGCRGDAPVEKLEAPQQTTLPSAAQLEAARNAIIAEVVSVVRGLDASGAARSAGRPRGAQSRAREDRRLGLGWRRQLPRPAGSRASQPPQGQRSGAVFRDGYRDGSTPPPRRHGASRFALNQQYVVSPYAPLRLRAEPLRQEIARPRACSAGSAAHRAPRGL